jgi:hypothetical protein
MTIYVPLGRSVVVVAHFILTEHTMHFHIGILMKLNTQIKKTQEMVKGNFDNATLNTYNDGFDIRDCRSPLVYIPTFQTPENTHVSISCQIDDGNVGTIYFL